MIMCLHMETGSIVYNFICCFDDGKIPNIYTRLTKYRESNTLYSYVRAEHIRLLIFGGSRSEHILRSQVWEKHIPTTLYLYRNLIIELLILSQICS